MDKSLTYEDAYQAYETRFGESDERQQTLLLELTAQLNSITAAEPENSDAFHLLGLCWYELPNVSDKTQRQAEDAFRCCLAIDPGHQYANLFLGHVLFDMKQYAEADERFAKIDPDYFAAQTQQWRVVKNDELRLCCRLETETADVPFHELDALCVRYETDPEGEWITPQEIVMCLDGLASREVLPRETLQHYAWRVLAMLEASDNLRLAYLEGPIARLRRLSAS